MKGGDGGERNVVVDAKSIIRRRGSLADAVPAKTAFYDCEALRFEGKGKGGDGDALEEGKEEGKEEEEVWKDGNEAEELSDGLRKNFFSLRRRRNQSQFRRNSFEAHARGMPM